MPRSTTAQSIPSKPASAEPMGRLVFKAAVSYFMVMLAANWAFSPVREFFVRGGSDPVLASLSQAVAILLLLTYAAGWVVRTFGVPARLGPRLAVGLGAIVIFAAGEAVEARLLFGLNPLDLALALISPQGLVIVVVMIAAATLPALRSRSSEA